MKVMLKYELKRIFTKRLNRVLITIGLALSVILSFLAATSNRFVSPQGHLETGISATRKVVADKNRNKGLMTPKRISELITQDQRAFREYKDKGESDKIYGTSIQQYLDVEQLVSYILTGNEDYNPSVYLDVNPKKLLNIYKIREAKIQKLIRQNGKTEEQRKYLKAQYDKISTPYQYEAPDSWDTMQLYVVTYSIVLAVLMGVLASGIFSEEITLKADAIFFSSKYGRDKAIKTKISAGLITSTGIYWIGMCLFTVISLTLMGTSGSHTLMSMLNSYTIYNVTYGQAFYIMMFAGYIANLLATTVSMLVSAIMGSPNIAICIPFFFFCIMPFIGRLGGSKGIFLLTPDQLNNFQEIMKVTGKLSPGVTEPGTQTLNGVQATAYARIRYTAGDDFKRAERQRAVLQKVVEKLQQASPAQLNKIIDKVFPEVSTNFTMTEILEYAKDAFDYELGETTGFPFDKTTDTLGNVGSVVIPVTMESNVKQLHNFFYGESDNYDVSSTVSDISAKIEKKAGNRDADTDESMQEFMQQPEETYSGSSGTTKNSSGSTGTTGSASYRSGTSGNSGTSTGTGNGTTGSTGTTGNGTSTGDTSTGTGGESTGGEGTTE